MEVSNNFADMTMTVASEILMCKQMISDVSGHKCSLNIQMRQSDFYWFVEIMHQSNGYEKNRCDSVGESPIAI